MQQLTPQDTVFLSIETPELPTHIGGLVFLRPEEGSGFGFAAFAEFVRERLGVVDRFSWQLQEVPFGLDRPYWVTRENFDPADHIHEIRLPAPYSHESLSKLVGRIFERPMDRSRPLWDMTLIGGLPGGRYAVLWRTHHCMMDGASGASLSEQLFDIAPDAKREIAPKLSEDATAGERLSTSKIYGRAMMNASVLPQKQSKYLGQIAKSLLTKDEEKTEDKAGSSTSESDSNVLAPKSPLNGVVGPHRGFAWSSVSLDDVKRIKNTLGVTINDVVLAITGGAVRDYLEARDGLPSKSLIASVPVSMRAKGDTAIGNQIRELPIYWGTDCEDPIERLTAIHNHASEAKRQAHEGDAFDLIGMVSEALLPGALNLLMRGAAKAGDHMPLLANAVVSNVPMSPMPLYCAGALIEQVVPLSLLAPTQGLNITVLSYCGELHFGLVHDPALVPEAWDLAGLIGKNLQKLQGAVDREVEDPIGA